MNVMNVVKQYWKVVINLQIDSLDKLKRLLFIALLVVFGCEDEPEPKDCAGVEGGTATVDECDECVGGNTIQYKLPYALWGVSRKSVSRF